MMHPRLIIAVIAAFLLTATVQRGGVAQGAVTDYNYNPNNDYDDESGSSSAYSGSTRSSLVVRRAPTARRAARTKDLACERSRKPRAKATDSAREVVILPQPRRQRQQREFADSEADFNIAAIKPARPAKAAARLRVAASAQVKDLSMQAGEQASGQASEQSGLLSWIWSSLFRSADYVIPERPTRRIRVGSYNLQNFGAKKLALLRSAGLLPALVQTLLRFDIVLLLELRGNTDNAAVDELLGELNRAARTRAYEMVVSAPQGVPGKHQEKAAYLYRPDVATLVDSYSLESSGTQGVFQRMLGRGDAPGLRRAPFVAVFALAFDSIAEDFARASGVACVRVSKVPAVRLYLPLVGVHLSPEAVQRELEMLYPEAWGLVTKRVQDLVGAASRRSRHEQHRAVGGIVLGDFNADGSYLSAKQKRASNVFSGAVFDPAVPYTQSTMVPKELTAIAMHKQVFKPAAKAASEGSRRNYDNIMLAHDAETPLHAEAWWMRSPRAHVAPVDGGIVDAAAMGISTIEASLLSDHYAVGAVYDVSP